MKTNSREKMLFIVAILAIVLLGGDRYVLTPLQKLWSDRSDRIVKLRKDLEKGNLRLNHERITKTRWANMESNSLPADVSAAEVKLQRAVHQWAQDSSINVSSIKPQWKQNGEDYTELECQADAMGNMQSLARFVYAMEKDPLPLKVDDVTIASKDNEGQQLTLHVRFTALQLTNNSK